MNNTFIHLILKRNFNTNQLTNKYKAMQNLKVTTTYPDQRLEFNEWCEQFKVSTMYVDRTPIMNAQRIMSLWDGFFKMKEMFIRKGNIK